MAELTPEARALVELLFRRPRNTQFGSKSRSLAITSAPKNAQRVLQKLKSGEWVSSRDSRKILEDAALGRTKRAWRRDLDPTKWRRLRYEALCAAGGKCACCGRSAKDGLELHVDHIKPVSKYPELALEPTNLQVLCGECNVGKLNRDETDWR